MIPERHVGKGNMMCRCVSRVYSLFRSHRLDLVAEEENTLLDETTPRLLRKLDVFMTIKND